MGLLSSLKTKRFTVRSVIEQSFFNENTRIYYVHMGNARAIFGVNLGVL